MHKVSCDCLADLISNTAGLNAYEKTQAENDHLGRSISHTVGAILQLLGPDDLVVGGEYPAYLAGILPRFDFIDVFVNGKVKIMAMNLNFSVFLCCDVKQGGLATTLYHLLAPWVRFKNGVAQVNRWNDLDYAQGTLGRVRFTFFMDAFPWAPFRPSVHKGIDGLVRGLNVLCFTGCMASSTPFQPCCVSAYVRLRGGDSTLDITPLTLVAVILKSDFHSPRGRRLVKNI